MVRSDALKRQHKTGTLCVGCLVTRGDEVLLVRHTYGPTRGRWDFPRGHVEVDELLEAAAVREVQEETAVAATPISIVALRDQMGVGRDGAPDHDVLVIWHMTHVAGLPAPDGREVCAATFMSRTQALSAPDVSNWTKELIRTLPSGNGLTHSTYSPGQQPDAVHQWQLFIAKEGVQ
ncbi:MAG: NUDIX domain-containing protein [Mycobacterium leprae]